uniref:Uncharacterized protein n=1 Tax=Craspedostauros australis TaxID=1486917 RepID=A0A6T6HL95_9STRA
MGPRTPTYVQACYDEAIEKARSRNHIHEAGLACEMAGEAFLRISTRDARDRTSNLIRHYFTRAAEFYEAWGAVTKCEDLRQRRGDHIDEDLVRHARKSDGVIAQTVALMDPQRLDACFDLVTVRTPEATVVPTVTSTGLRSDDLRSRARQNEKSYAIHETVEGHANGDDDDDDLSVLTDMS